MNAYDACFPETDDTMATAYSVELEEHVAEVASKRRSDCIAYRAFLS